VADAKEIKSNIARLALSVARRVRNANAEEKVALACSLSLLSVASSTADANESLARNLYSQARQLSNIKGIDDDEPK